MTRKSLICAIAIAVPVVAACGAAGLLVRAATHALGAVLTRAQGEPRGAALFEAVHRGDAAAVRRLLANGQAPDAAGPKRQRPIDIAACRGDVAILRMLLNAGAPVDTPNAVGDTPLMLAAACRRAEAVDELVRRGANINASGPGALTPLMDAARAGDPEAVRLLLSRGADPMMRSADGKTALDYARAALSDPPAQPQDLHKRRVRALRELQDALQHAGGPDGRAHEARQR